MTKISIFSVFGLLALTACTGPVIMGTDAAVVYVTKPSEPPPADTKDQIPEHTTWCYVTMAESQCYAHAQNVAPDRLINVDPQSLYPVDASSYRQAVAAKPAPLPASGEPMALESVTSVPVERGVLNEEINADPSSSNVKMP